MKEMEAVGCGCLGAGHVGRDCDVGVEAAAHLWGGGSAGSFDLLLEHKNTSHPSQHIPPDATHNELTESKTRLGISLKSSENPQSLILCARDTGRPPRR